MLYDILSNSPSVLVRVLACGNYRRRKKAKKAKSTKPVNLCVALAIIMNVREVIQMTETWDEGQDATGSELIRRILPILVSSLEYDIQEAAEKCIAAANSGVRTLSIPKIYLLGRVTNRVNLEREQARRICRNHSKTKAAIDCRRGNCLDSDVSDAYRYLAIVK